ncbi:O-antigen ligase family protein [Candidatus Pelagibacter sp.]|nr:O-antigen ligase family protein [Candidatus Pelagibacter sp.]
MLAIIYAIDKDINFSKNFFKIIFLVLVFVGLDTLFQYFNEKDIFGFKIDEGHGRRLSGPFGDEYIVGSYMCKFFFLSLLFFEEKNLKYFKSFLIVAFLMLIVLTNERAASIMFFISTIIYLLLNNEFSIKEKCLGFLIFLTLLISLFSLNKNLKNHFFDRTFEQIGITQTNKISHNNFLDSQWGAHFLTSIEIYKNNKFWGSGIKTFRKECANENYSTIKTAEVKSRCNTHPHNIYLEILSETGLIGFIPFICIIFYLSARILKNLFFNSKSYNKNLIIGLSFFILFNPFQTTGAFFSTWNGSFYWIIIPFVIRINNVFLKTKETQQYG